MRVTCLTCQAESEVADRYAGLRGKCRACGGVITVPGEVIAAAAPAPIEVAKQPEPVVTEVTPEAAPQGTPYGVPPQTAPALPVNINKPKNIYDVLITIIELPMTIVTKAFNSLKKNIRRLWI